MLTGIASAAGQLCCQPVVKSYIMSFYTLAFQVELVVHENPCNLFCCQS